MPYQLTVLRECEPDFISYIYIETQIFLSNSIQTLGKKISTVNILIKTTNFRLFFKNGVYPIRVKSYKIFQQNHIRILHIFTYIFYSLQT